MAQLEAKADDVEKHERVAKALEQVNGLRYRYTAGTSKPPRKDINVDSGEDDGSTDEEDNERIDAKSAGRRSTVKQSGELLTLDDHIERMLLRTRTVALLKIANNTADVLPDDDDDEEEDGDDEFGEFDERGERSFHGYGSDDDGDDGSFATRAEGGLDADEKSDRFDSRDIMASPLHGSHSSSVQRMGSMRRPTSFRSSASKGTPVDPEAAAALRLVRKLSTFLSLPKVISYRDLEEITESLLNEPHDESEEYAHLIDEQVNSARDATGFGDSAITRSPTLRHLASKKSIRELNISEDPHDLELQQRRLFVENAGLKRYSSKRLVGASNRNLLLHGASHLSLNSSNGGGFGSSKQLLLADSPGVSARDLMVHKESKRALRAGESWRSGGPGSVASLAVEEADEKDAEDEDGGDVVGNLMSGVLGTTFDEPGYHQWRTEIKDDYLAWIRAKVEAKKQRRLQKLKDADKKPRWQLLYEAASKGRPTSAVNEPVQAERKPSTTKRRSRQSVS